MSSHTKSENRKNDLDKEKSKIGTNEDQENIQLERASIVDLYKYAGRRYYIILFIGITSFSYKMLK